MQKLLISLAILSAASLGAVSSTTAQDTSAPAKTETKPSTETKPAKPASETTDKDKSLDQFFKDIQEEIRENPSSCSKPDPVV